MSVRRVVDCLLGTAMLLAATPAILAGMLSVWLLDGGPPLYRAPRVGLHGRDFRMLKLRTMTVGADRVGGSSTARDDPRITSVGHVLRRWKIDELPQLVNVVRGEMSFVGPRPNVREGGIDRYSAIERRLLAVRPGITDIASIVFADESEILAGERDADAAYDRLVRPWKNRLALLGIAHGSMRVYFRVLWLTLLGLVARRRALAGVDRLLRRWDADPHLRAVCRRDRPPPEGVPPGFVA